MFSDELVLNLYIIMGPGVIPLLYIIVSFTHPWLLVRVFQIYYIWGSQNAHIMQPLLSKALYSIDFFLSVI